MTTGLGLVEPLLTWLAGGKRLAPVHESSADRKRELFGLRLGPRTRLGATTRLVVGARHCRMPVRVTAAVLASIVVIGTASCDPSDETSESTESAGSAAASSAPRPSAPVSSAPVTSTATSSRGSSAAGSDDAYCAALAEAKTDLEDAETDMMGPAISQNELDTYIAVAEKMAPIAPGEVADHWEKVGDNMRELDGLLAGAGLDGDDLVTLAEAYPSGGGADPAVLEDLLGKFEPILDDVDALMADPALEDAVDDIGEHGEAACGVSLED